MIVICGLGNPGKKYIGTRHNIGYDFINKIINQNNFKKIKKDNLKEVYQGSIINKKIFIVKPNTYMNVSGSAISSLFKYYKVSKNNLTIVHDDIDLKVGKIKLKKGGGNGGHNGLLSIDQAIGSNYKRLRVGIGHPGSKNLVNKYVLKKFNSEEKKIINNLTDICVENIALLFSNRELFLNKIFSTLNKKNNGI